MSVKSTYPLDPNHLGVRIAVLSSLGIGAIGGFVVLPIVASWLGIEGIAGFWIGVIGAIVVGSAVSLVIEYRLRNVWPSGRWLTINDEKIEMRAGDGSTATLQWVGRINVDCWYFLIPSARSLVPKGWYCAACRLMQDETTITTYTFVDPTEAQSFPGWEQFEQLHPQRGAQPGETSLLSSAQDQGALRTLERERWESGVEMFPNDFASFLKVIAQKIPDWALTTDHQLQKGR